VAAWPQSIGVHIGLHSVRVAFQKVYTAGWFIKISCVFANLLQMPRQVLTSYVYRFLFETF
jgi:hypothetical protein